MIVVMINIYILHSHRAKSKMRVQDPGPHKPGPRTPGPRIQNPGPGTQLTRSKDPGRQTWDPTLRTREPIPAIQDKDLVPLDRLPNTYSEMF